MELSDWAFSASQIETYLSCQRKFGWIYIAKEPRVTHPSAALGSRTHKQLERYLGEGKPLTFSLPSGEPDDSGGIAETAIPHLPKPMTLGLDVEGAFSFVSPLGHKYRGFLDWRHPHWPESIPTVGDHKTCGTFRYALSEKDLETNVQAVIYAYDTMRHYHVPRVRLQWTYMQTRGARRALPVVRIVEKNAVDAAFAEVEVIAGEILTIMASTTKDQILSLPATIATCEAYGGCPYQHKCALSPMERMRSAMSNAGTGGSSLVERMRARNAAKAAETIAPAQIPGGTPVAAIVNTAFGPGVNLDAGPSEVAAALDTIVNAPPSIVETTPGQINPPEQSPHVTVLDADAETKKAGRPKGSKNKPKESASAYAAPVAPVAPVETAVEAIVPDAVALAGRIPFLFVDCMPVGMSAIRFAAVAQLSETANEKIKEEKGVADYRYIEYGAGPGALVRTALELLDAMDVVPALFLDSHTPEGSALLSALSVRSDVVVRGLR